jgi:hypothetical protein
MSVPAEIAVKVIYVAAAASALVVTRVVEPREVAVAWSASTRLLPGRSKDRS